MALARRIAHNYNLAEIIELKRFMKMAAEGLFGDFHLFLFGNVSHFRQMRMDIKSIGYNQSVQSDTCGMFFSGVLV